MERHAEIPESPTDLTDILLAVRSKLAVLITAPPDEALDIARAIAEQRGASDDLVICDFGAHRGSLADEAPTRRPRILLLREVHDLTPRQQARLMEMMDEQRDVEGAPRIIASSSVSLFDCVRRGSFDERLFYRLNTIHLAMSAAEPASSGVTVM
jgi:hypothetical protein